MFSRSIRFARTGITASRVAWRPARCKAHGATRSIAPHSHEYIFSSFFFLFFPTSWSWVLRLLFPSAFSCFAVFSWSCASMPLDALVSPLRYRNVALGFNQNRACVKNTLCVTPQESQLFSICFSRLKYRSPFYSHSLDVVAGIWYPGSTPAMTVARVLLCPAINGLLVALYFGRHLHDIIVLLTCSRQWHT